MPFPVAKSSSFELKRFLGKNRFSHCQSYFMSRYIVLMENDFIILQSHHFVFFEPVKKMFLLSNGYGLTLFGYWNRTILYASQKNIKSRFKLMKEVLHFWCKQSTHKMVWFLLTTVKTMLKNSYSCLFLIGIWQMQAHIYVDSRVPLKVHRPHMIIYLPNILICGWHSWPLVTSITFKTTTRSHNKIRRLRIIYHEAKWMIVGIGMLSFILEEQFPLVMSFYIPYFGSKT